MTFGASHWIKIDACFYFGADRGGSLVIMEQRTYYMRQKKMQQYARGPVFCPGVL